MADTGWVYAASGRNINIGKTDWANPANVCGASDSVWASNPIPADDTGDELNAYNFSISVPAGKQIDGIQCAMYKLEAVVNIKDYHVYLMNDTTHKGENKADTSTYWPSSAAWVYYGGASDLWNASWTITQVNASTFGVIVRAKNYHASQAKSAYVDSIGLKIFYSDIVHSNHLMIMGM